jgi:hypothetical protein
MKPRGEQRTVHRAYADEREPQDPLTGAPAAVADAPPTDASPVRHLAYRMLEALS